MTKWQWFAGASCEEYMTIGPCETREQVIAEAIQDGFGEYLDETVNPPKWMNRFHICEARNDPLRLADWIGTELLLERAEESISDSDRASCEYDDGPYFEVTPEQESDLTRRIAQACDEWQAAHGLVFTCNTFSAVRNDEDITTPVLRNAPE